MVSRAREDDHLDTFIRRRFLERLVEILEQNGRLCISIAWTIERYPSDPIELLEGQLTIGHKFLRGLCAHYSAERRGKSLSERSPIHRHRQPGDVGGALRTQPRNRLADFFRLAETLERFRADE